MHGKVKASLLLVISMIAIVCSYPLISEAIDDQDTEFAMKTWNSNEDDNAAARASRSASESELDTSHVVKKDAGAALSTTTNTVDDKDYSVYDGDADDDDSQLTDSLDASDSDNEELHRDQRHLMYGTDSTDSFRDFVLWARQQQQQKHSANNFQGHVVTFVAQMSDVEYDDEEIYE